MEMRKSLGIRDGDKMNITAQGNVIMLEKYEESDCFTGDTDDLIDYKGKKVSKASILELARLAGIVKE
jgi:transcriptional pleiotropic regulator of transition state genes